MSQTGGLPPEEIIRRIEKALARDKAYDWATLRPLIVDGRAQIFWNEHGAWITEIVVAPLTRWLNVWVVAGQLPGVLDLQPQVIAYAKANGCRYLSATARFGWKTRLKAFGWKAHATQILMEVT